MKAKQPKPKTVTKGRGYLRGFLTIGRIAWAGIVVIATLLSYAVLKPSIAIEPYASQDARQPFAEQFYLQNNSIYQLDGVTPYCSIIDVRAGNLRMRGFTLVNPPDFVGPLDVGAKTTITCRLDSLFSLSNRYGPLQIILWVTYKTPLGFSGCKASNFDGKPVADGTFIWTYRGSPACPKSN